MIFFHFQIEDSALKSLDLIESTACIQNDESLLDLRLYPLAKGAKDLGSILGKLLDKTSSIESDLSSFEVPRLPIDVVGDAVDVVTRHKQNFIALRRHLDVDLTPSLEHQIASLRSQLSGVDWRRVFGRNVGPTQADATHRDNDADEFVVPPSPGNSLSN